MGRLGKKIASKAVGPGRCEAIALDADLEEIDPRPRGLASMLTVHVVDQHFGTEH